MNKGNENKNAEISARIAEILQYTSETRNSFAVKLGYERAQTVYDIMNMKSAPSYDFFRRFSVSEYSDIIDVRWLLSGRGSMLRESVQPPSEPIPASSDAVTLRLMDKLDDKDRKLDEKDTLLKEKDAENKHLQSELRSMEKELAVLKAQYQHPESLKRAPKGSDPVKPASTKQPSPPIADNVTSANVP